MKSSSLLRLAVAFVALGSMAGCQKKPAPASPQVPSPTSTKIVSAEPTSFEAVARHLDPGGSAYCYFSTDQIIKWLSGYRAAMEPMVMQGVTSKMEPAEKARTEAMWGFAMHFVGECGLKEISGVGYSAIALEPGYFQKKLVFRREPSKGNGLFWKIHGTEPTPLAFIDYLPANTMLGCSGNTKWLPVWEELNRRAAAQPDVKSALDNAAASFQKATGLDLAALLGSLGPNYSLLLTLDEWHPVTIPAGQNPITIPEPALAYWVQVQNALLINKLEETLSKNPMAAKSEVEGWTVYNLNVPMLKMMAPWLQPAVAWRQGTVALFSNGALLGEMLAVKAGKKPGLAASANFIKLRRGMPASGTGFAYLAPSFQKTIQGIRTSLSKEDPASKQVMDKVYALSGVSEVYSVSSNTEEGSVSISHEKKR